MVQFFWRGFYSVFMVIFQERSLGSFEKTNVCAGWEVIFGQTGFFLKTNIEYRVLCVQSELISIPVYILTTNTAYTF